MLIFFHRSFLRSEKGRAFQAHYSTGGGKLQEQKRPSLGRERALLS